jgi:hypothetical protein
MKASMLKRYDLVKAALNQAEKDMTSGAHGILAIDSLIKAETEAGNLVFDMVMHEKGSAKDLQKLVSHRVLLQVILAGLDHRNMIMSRVNQEKSRDGMRTRIRLLYDWLDQNIHHYQRRLEDCSEDAVQQIPGLRMTPGTVKKHITQYRKQKALAAVKSLTKSTKKRK